MHNSCLALCKILAGATTSPRVDYFPCYLQLYCSLDKTILYLYVSLFHKTATAWRTGKCGFVYGGAHWTQAITGYHKYWRIAYQKNIILLVSKCMYFMHAYFLVTVCVCVRVGVRECVSACVRVWDVADGLVIRLVARGNRNCCFFK